MTREMLAQALEAEGIKPSSHAYALPETRDVTCFIAGQGDVMSVPRVTKIELLSNVVRLETGKQEHLYFAYEDVLGIRLVAAAASSKERGAAGFAR